MHTVNKKQQLKLTRHHYYYKGAWVKKEKNMIKWAGFHIMGTSLKV